MVAPVVDEEGRRLAEQGDVGPAGEAPGGPGQLQVLALPLGLVDAPQQGGDLIILALGDRVELVVVAVDALDREAEERLAEGADEVLQLVSSGGLAHRGRALDVRTWSQVPATW